MALFLLGLVLFGHEAPGQNVTYVSPNPKKSGGFGGSVAGVGDLNGDGTADILVGAPGEQVGTAMSAGRVYLFSGDTGEVFRTLSAPEPVAEGYFGTTMTELGDVTGDGVPEIAIGAFGSRREGRVYVFRGTERTVLHTFKSPNATHGGLFGRALESIGDVNGDGVPDLAVGAIGEGEDRVYLFGGANGHLLYTLESPTDGHDHFGQIVALDDVDGDGVSDLLVGASTTTVGARSSAGRAYLYSGKEGTRIRTLTPPTSGGGHFGYLVASGGDVNGDAVPDAVVGAVGEGGAAGRLFVYDGSGGTVLQTLRPPSPSADGYRGYSARFVGDVVGTEAADLVLGTRVPATDSVRGGRVYLYDGATGQRHRTFSPSEAGGKGQFGASVAPVRDGEHAGARALLVGAPGETVRKKAGAGRVYRFTLQ